MPNNFDKLFNQAQGNELINALKGIKSSLDVNYPLETVNVTLSNNAQNITPSENYYGLGQVNVPGMNLSDMTILVNGNYDPVTSGLDGYGKLNVNVPNTYSASDEGKVVDNGALVSQTSRTVTENGTYATTTNDEVVVDVSGGSGTLITKNITENGTYNANDDNADGYSSVTVNVSSGSYVKPTLVIYAKDGELHVGAKII